MKHGILSIQGADCPSCVFAIEYNARKINGLKDIRVDVNTHKIHVHYQGSANTLAGIKNIVDKLGYSAKIISES